MNRVTWIGIVLFGMYLGFSSKHVDLSSACHAQDNPKAYSGQRVLHFPSDQSVGVLRVGRLKGPNFIMDFEQLRSIAAKGEVQVSDDNFVDLNVGSVDDLGFLEQLPPGALQGLEVTGLVIDRKALALITRLDGLRTLRLAKCQFKKDTFEEAKSLSSLLGADVDTTTLDGLTFASWIATMPQFEYLNTRPSLDALAYGKLSGHPTLATTTIDIANDQAEWPLAQLRLPALRELIVNCSDGASPRALDAISALADLETISVSSGTVDGDLLKKIGALGTVRRLKLIYNKMGPGFLEGVETLQSVEQLDLYVSKPAGADLTFFFNQLAAAVLKLPRIKKIPQIRKPSLQILQQIIARTDLESLDFDEWNDRIPIATLQDLNKLKGLKSLKLSYVPITDDDLQYLSKLESLEDLTLFRTEVQGQGLVHLGNLPRLRKMLVMMDTRRVKPDLSGFSHLSRLEDLQLWGEGFAPEHYFPIAQCSSLRSVSLSFGKIDDSVVTRLATLPNLARIYLDDSSMTDEGARAMARNQNLESIVLGGMISRAAVLEFSRLPKLTWISIKSSELDPVDCVDLQFEFPSVGSFRFTTKER